MPMSEVMTEELKKRVDLLARALSTWEEGTSTSSLEQLREQAKRALLGKDGKPSKSRHLYLEEVHGYRAYCGLAGDPGWMETHVKTSRGTLTINML